MHKNFVVGNFTGDLNRVHPRPQISKLTVDTLLWVSGAESHPGTFNKVSYKPVQYLRLKELCLWEFYRRYE